jgi:hypothetical protein
VDKKRKKWKNEKNKNKKEEWEKGGIKEDR